MLWIKYNKINKRYFLIKGDFYLKIILTGGGTAGHVTPNFALVPYLKKNNFDIEYIGSKNGIEKDLVRQENIIYHGISCGKLRRYFSLKNFSDIINIIKGIFEADKLIKKIKPNIIFSKGGFVSVPVVISGWLNKIPVVIHESDMSPGLANKISLPFAKVMCTSFLIKNMIKDKDIKYKDVNIKKNSAQEKYVLTGAPVRQELFNGNAERARKKLNFDSRPVLLIIGGSQGSKKINGLIRNALNKLNSYQIIHVCGKNNLEPDIKQENYRQFEYVSRDLADYFKLADIIISRSGSNSIFEILALKKLNLLIPLSKKASRGDQILNAKFFESQGFSEVLLEENLNQDLFLDAIKKLLESKELYIKRMQENNFINGCEKIMAQIKKYARE